MEVLIPIHGDCFGAIEACEERGHAAPLLVSAKSKERDCRFADCDMYARCLRPLHKRLDGGGDDAPKLVTPQRGTKNKKTISDDDSNLLYYTDSDSIDENTNLLPSNANDYDFDLSPLFPANDVDTELLTPSSNV